jgi:uncharacterized membrane protein
MALFRSRHGVIVLAGLIVGWAQYSSLPIDMPPTRLSVVGTLGIGRPMAAFLLPVAAAITYVMLRSLYAGSGNGPHAAPNPLATYDALMFRVLLFLTAIHAAVLVGLSAPPFGNEWVGRALPALLGATLVSVGNLLPRIPPNLAIGIRTAATLADRQVWRRTHLAAGYVMVAAGAAILFAAAVLPAPLGSRAVLAVAPVALLALPFVVAYGKRARV